MPSRTQNEQADQPLAPDSEAAGACDEPALAKQVTPSMAQYLEIKAANPDSLLWYRMGDFYELFFEDAVVAARALGIVLTKRGKHHGQDIPMCGVPVIRADEYLQRLIKQGYRVAVCEQIEDPAEARKRGSKAVVRRDVVRLVTPGTLTEDALLDARARNYLTAVYAAPQTAREAVPHFGLASLDISTGELELAEVTEPDLSGELARLAPGEIVASDAGLSGASLRRWLDASRVAATPVPAATFDSMAGERQLKARLGVADLGAFGSFSRAELAAAAALLKYVELTQIGRQPMLRPPRKAGPATSMAIDAATRASLEILRSTSGERQGSLLGAIDRTVTGPGARELAARLANPLLDPHTVSARLDAVAYFVDRDDLRDGIRAALRAAPDMARAQSRLALQRGGPADLVAIREGLIAGKHLGDMLGRSAGTIGLPGELAAASTRLLAAGASLAEELGRALTDDPPLRTRDGGFVRAGYHTELDDTRRLRDDSRKVIATLEASYIERTGVRSLKVRHNNILGYFIEATVANAKPLLSPPLSDLFRHRQTMANAMRFTTPELVETEGRIASAAERALAIEHDVFRELTAMVAAKAREISEVAAALAEADLYAALAELAQAEGYVRPRLSDGTALEIRDGRHPVVEQALRQGKLAPFIENDCILAGAWAGSGSDARSGEDEAPAAAPGRIWLVTGPNMAGKSTFLRQNALITLMAQAGSFVPARSATIGIVDRLFSRVGAADDLARGRSTFMVEMVETAAILHQATARSLVILDEIGRGTATFDGLSIAWATVEYLHDVCHCRALFATHYHELTALSRRLEGIANVTMDVKEWRDEIVFLHKVRSGAADRSYGIQVAKLAGLPPAVIKRAGEVLAKLEKSEGGAAVTGAALDDLPLFAAARTEGAKREPRWALEVARALDEINPDALSPRAALDALYQLKAMRRSDEDR